MEATPYVSGGRWLGQLRRWSREIVILFPLLLSTAPAQNAPVPSSDAGEMRELLLELRQELRQTRAELSRAQQQIEQLNGEVAGLRRDLSGRLPASAARPSQMPYPPSADTNQQATEQAASSAQSLDQLSEDQKLLKAQVDEQHQTKVESASKYRVKISGLILMNAYSNRGAVDINDLPNRALDSSEPGTVGATVRQSVLGLQVYGPEIAGAHSSGNISADFFGGFPQQPFGTTAGLMRLRVAGAHLDWRDTSVTAGQEELFFSPLSPTSYATLAEPAFAWSGNLWVWTPQVAGEHRFHTSDQSYFSVTGGLLAPLTEDLPNAGVAVPGYALNVNSNPGGRGRRPAFAASVGWNSRAFGDTIEFGLGGYTSHLRYNFGRETDSWAVTSYWQVPLGSRVQLSGEAYRGMAVGGLGGGIWQSVVYNGNPNIASTVFRPLNAVGGWAQTKIRLSPRWETNAAFGQDNVLAHDLRWAPLLQSNYGLPIARNRAAFGNVIFRPKSSLLLSAEYRKIWTFNYVGPLNAADQINVGAGVSF